MEFFQVGLESFLGEGRVIVEGSPCGVVRKNTLNSTGKQDPT